MPASAMFACDGYGIDDARLASHSELTISFGEGPAPRLGDPFTIVRNQTLHDLVVKSVLQSGAGWAACCGLVRA